MLSSSFMTSFCSIFLVLMAFTISPSLSLSSDPTSTISAAPAFLPDSPLPSPTSNLSPDITPLLPSPKGISPSPTEESSTLPTIPSTPSPPNPDEMYSYGPDSALPPSGSMPTMLSAASVHLAGSLNLSGLVGLVIICLVPAFW
ncbi:hypothetical protein AQUCO_00300895v1 [Aquilegia coerulea]|uniref:Uncharacterized protein n=1 Tax=Aquilegia coerulea TaxID=218851 RepID=A0A2G5F0Y0_AQUCA|nr:hypothetical protein AQUCO_00300895v1 [Aquilegia coerulea]